MKAVIFDMDETFFCYVVDLLPFEVVKTVWRPEGEENDGRGNDTDFGFWRTV